MHFALRALDLHNEQRDAEAATLLDYALKMEPTLTFALYLKGLIAMAQGDFATGLPLQELRYQCRGTQAYGARYKSRMPWNGEPTGARVLLWGEQGYGDMIQMMRFVPAVAERCPNMMLEIQEPLLELAQQVFPTAFPVSDRYPEFDLHCSLTSLPFVLGVRLDTIPAQPYLEATPLENAYRLKVGICWARDTDTPTRQARNMTNYDIAPLADEFDLLSLQHENTTCETFADTASLLAGLDLIIAVDCALVHLAGALGIPVWIMLSVNCDVRWMRGRLDSPWYPTARLFRQREQGDWGPVVDDVARALKEVSNARSLAMAS